MGSKLTPVEDRLLVGSHDAGDCREWNKPGPDGYGRIHYMRRDQLAHRVSFQVFRGEIPDGMLVDHLCHNHACVKPEHLRLATKKQNAENRAANSYRGASGIRGACWDKSKNRWMAVVTHNGKTVFCGYFDTPEKAGEAARQRRLELFTHNDLDRLEWSGQ